MKERLDNSVAAIVPLPQTIISVRGSDGRNNALDVGYVGNASHDPAMVMIGIEPSRYSHAIVKETGCGMAREQAKQLRDCGVAILDIGGAGGTNFPAIEHCRYAAGNAELGTWGIPTALSLLEVVPVMGWQHGIIASGGIRTALDVVKAQVLGASAAAMAGNILRVVLKHGSEEAAGRILRCLENIKDFYVLLGCQNAAQLRRARYWLTGAMAEAVRSLEHVPDNTIK